jgi:glucose-6-phosphate isomerase
MESLGKPTSKESEFKKTGQIIFGGYGPTAQHSYFQLLHQGTQEICADLIASKEDPKSLSYAQAITQARLLSNGADDLSDEKERINGNVPVNLFLLNKIDPFTLGYLIATWEHRTYITAAMLKINPFDQFGVSAGKIYTKKYLSIKD